VATGDVVSWKADKGYGFIKPDVEGPDVFLHVAELAGIASAKIHRGVRVTYRLGHGERGPKACEVTLAPRDDGAMADFLPAEEHGNEVMAILSEAADKIVNAAKRHGWVE
jgi:cold shock CspA family protein